MASILKSSHVMSSEVKFDALLSSMVDIILENSGKRYYYNVKTKSYLYVAFFFLW